MKIKKINLEVQKEKKKIETNNSEFRGHIEKVDDGIRVCLY